MLFNETKIILDLCGGTGAWSKPYREAGYDVRLVTLPEQDVTDYIPPDNVYGILAAPPCDQFSIARTTAKTPRDFVKGMIPVNACIRIIWQCQQQGNLQFWAIENPIGHLSKFIGEFQYRFDPWWFGDPWTKRTALWGKFNKPKRRFTRKTDVLSREEILKCKTNSRSLRITDKWSGEKAKVLRAITPAGFAQAFFEANQ